MGAGQVMRAALVLAGSVFRLSFPKPHRQAKGFSERHIGKL